MNSVQSKFIASEELQRMPRSEAAERLGCTPDWLNRIATMHNLSPPIHSFSSRRLEIGRAKERFLAEPDLQDLSSIRAGYILGVSSETVCVWRRKHNIPKPSLNHISRNIMKHPDFRMVNGKLAAPTRKIAQEVGCSQNSVLNLMIKLGWRAPSMASRQRSQVAESLILHKWPRPDNMNSTVMPLIRSKREKLRQTAS